MYKFIQKVTENSSLAFVFVLVLVMILLFIANLVLAVMQ